jgi:hypothetical protein
MMRFDGPNLAKGRVPGMPSVILRSGSSAIRLIEQGADLVLQTSRSRSTE